MGEQAEMMVNGEVCTICGMFFDEEYGYPKACEACGGDGVLLGEGDEDDGEEDEGDEKSEFAPEDFCHEHDRKEFREGR